MPGDLCLLAGLMASSAKGCPQGLRFHWVSIACGAGSPCSYPHLPKEVAVCLLLPAAWGVLGLPVAVLCGADPHQLHGRHQDLLLLLALCPGGRGVRWEQTSGDPLLPGALCHVL